MFGLKKDKQLLAAVVERCGFRLPFGGLWTWSASYARRVNRNLPKASKLKETCPLPNQWWQHRDSCSYRTARIFPITLDKRRSDSRRGRETTLRLVKCKIDVSNSFQDVVSVVVIQVDICALLPRQCSTEILHPIERIHFIFTDDNVAKLLCSDS